MEEPSLEKGFDYENRSFRRNTFRTWTRNFHMGERDLNKFFWMARCVTEQHFKHLQRKIKRAKKEALEKSLEGVFFARSLISPISPFTRVLLLIQYIGLGRGKMREKTGIFFLFLDFSDVSWGNNELLRKRKNWKSFWQWKERKQSKLVSELFAQKERL